jgi:hypothetical protein
MASHLHCYCIQSVHWVYVYACISIDKVEYMVFPISYHHGTPESALDIVEGPYGLRDGNWADIEKSMFQSMYSILLISTCILE